MLCLLALACVLGLPRTLGVPAAPGLSKPMDLSHYFDEETLYWPGGTNFHFTKETILKTPSGDFYAANDFETAEHGGTHLDAPYHFNKNGWHVGEIPFERFFGKAVLLNLRAKAKADPDYLVTAEDFIEWEKRHGAIPEGAIVMMDFGWAQKYHNKTLFFGSEDPKNASTFHFPGLSEDGAKWLVATGKVYAVGTDTASIDYGPSKDYPAHIVLNDNNLYMLEQVALPATVLPRSGYRFLALPMKIHYGTGGPVRVVALP